MRFARRGFRHRSRARWLWGDNFELVLSSAAAVAIGDFFPTGLVEYRGGGRSLTVKRMLVWLDAFWRDSSIGVAATNTLPQVNMYIMKTERDAATVEADDFQPFKAPVPPASMTTWESDDGDAVDPFVWVHRLQPTSIPFILSPTDGLIINPSGFQPALATQPTHPGAGTAMPVKAAFMPTLDLRVKRRLRAGEHLIFGIALDPGITISTNLALSVHVAHRILC